MDLAGEAAALSNARPATAGSEPQVAGMVDHLFRSRAGQMVAYLTRLLGPEHLELAEEVVQEALLKALQKWPYSGIPENPAGWLFQAARNAALDVVRRNSVFAQKSAAIAAELERSKSRSEPAMSTDLRDDELRMVFMCCHPALPRDARVALSLKTVGGFSVREVARAFLAEEPTIAQRLVRAKKQIKQLQLSFELPRGPELAERLDSVLEVIYLMFNEGYAAHEGEDLVRQDLCREALRLGRLVAASALGPPTAHALVALMAFQAARLPARTDERGDLVLLDDQDRARWDERLVSLGFHHFTQCAAGDVISEYHVQAAIASVHARAKDPSATDWKAILALYDQLLALNPSPVVALNRAVAVSKVRGPRAALTELEPLGTSPWMNKYYLFFSVRARLLLDAGDRAAAAESYRRALELPCSEPERRFLKRKLGECL
ncbi:MAG TPA: sigma-70 family RNA polymerase sigma factor [Terriglobales bacterium]|nr:sigma-70 family RNA polymerase sigma factor [Terriglobales bacterium]